MRFRWCVISVAAMLATATAAVPDLVPPDTPAAAVDTPADPAATFGIDWHAINPGVSRAASSCFRLSATLGQPVPGHAVGGSFVVTSGFWAGAPTSGLDTIFFHGFEGCGA